MHNASATARIEALDSSAFIAEDPLDFGGGDPNLYGYVQDDPIELRDQDGTGPIGGALVEGVCLGASVYEYLNISAEIAQLGSELNSINNQLDNLNNQLYNTDDPDTIDDLKCKIEKAEQQYNQVQQNYVALHLDMSLTEGIGTVGCGTAAYLALVFAPF